MTPIADNLRELHGVDPQALPDELLTGTQPVVLRGLAHEVEFASRRDLHPVVPALEQGRLRLVG